MKQKGMKLNGMEWSGVESRKAEYWECQSFYFDQLWMR